MTVLIYLFVTINSFKFAGSGSEKSAKRKRVQPLPITYTDEEQQLEPPQKNHVGSSSNSQMVATMNDVNDELKLLPTVANRTGKRKLENAGSDAECESLSLPSPSSVNIVTAASVFDTAAATVVAVTHQPVTDDHVSCVDSKGVEELMAYDKSPSPLISADVTASSAGVVVELVDILQGAGARGAKDEEEEMLVEEEKEEESVSSPTAALVDGDVVSAITNPAPTLLDSDEPTKDNDDDVQTGLANLVEFNNEKAHDSLSSPSSSPSPSPPVASCSPITVAPSECLSEEPRLNNHVPDDCGTLALESKSHHHHHGDGDGDNVNEITHRKQVIVEEPGVAEQLEVNSNSSVKEPDSVTLKNVHHINCSGMDETMPVAELDETVGVLYPGMKYIIISSRSFHEVVILIAPVTNRKFIVIFVEFLGQYSSTSRGGEIERRIRRSRRNQFEDAVHAAEGRPRARRSAQTERIE